MKDVRDAWRRERKSDASIETKRTTENIDFSCTEKEESEES